MNEVVGLRRATRFSGMLVPLIKLGSTFNELHSGYVRIEAEKRCKEEEISSALANLV